MVMHVFSPNTQEEEAGESYEFEANQDITQ